MSSESHRVGYHQANAPAYDDDGEPVNVTWDSHGDEEPGDTEAARIRQETIARLVQWLCRGRVGAMGIGRRALILNYALRPHGTRAKLARRLGVGRSAVTEALNTLGRDGLNIDA